MLKTVTVEKVDEKNEVICLASMFPCQVAILCCSQQETWVCWSNLYIWIWKFSLHSFRKWNVLRRAEPQFMKYCQLKYQKVCWLRSNLIKFVQTFDICKTVRHSIINNTYFWKCVTRSFGCISVNCFNTFKCLADFSIKLQKAHFFKTISGP